MAKGGSVADASGQIGVAEQTLYRWRKEYGGMRIDQARRMQGLEAENVRLKKLVADTAKNGRPTDAPRSPISHTTSYPPLGAVQPAPMAIGRGASPTTRTAA
ncbi:MAG: hypothetical protein EXQ93_04840, partial [Alphaproteobacteria bacterium]|nr:hypothetical protein [Alphaproteobacteria bacterium]